MVRYILIQSRERKTQFVHLGNEVLLKLAKELQVEQVIWGQSFLTNNCLHGLDILANGIAGV